MEVLVSMMQNVRKAGSACCVAAALLVAAAPARAQNAPLFGGFYGALGVGVVGLEDSNLDYGGASPNRSIEYYAGWGVSGALGFRLLRYYRLEVEISHRENDVYDVDPGFAPDGTVKTTTYMVNGYYDFPVYSLTGFVPYIGAGVGRAQFSQNVQIDGGTLSNSSSHAFAYQVIGGLEFPVIPRQMSVTLEYRYLATARPLFQDTSGAFYHTDYDSHTVMFGARWAF
jgi:opacity protein-like surface antigen